MPSFSSDGALFAAIAHLPEWLRVDLSAKDPAVRRRAEETLAAMVRAAVDAEDRGRPARATLSLAAV